MDNLVINIVARNALTKLAVLLLGMSDSALVTRGLATEKSRQTRTRQSASKPPTP